MRAFFLHQTMLRYKLILLLACFSLQTNAQDLSYYFGVNLENGVSTFIVNEENTSSYHPTTYQLSHSYGLSFEHGIIFGKRVELSTGIGYSKYRVSGEKISIRTSDYSYYYAKNGTYDLQYWSVPIKVGILFGKEHSHKLSLGVVPSIMIDGKVKGNIVYSYETSPIGEWGHSRLNETDRKSVMNNLSFLGTMGYARSIQLKEKLKLNLGLNAYYQLNSLKNLESENYHDKQVPDIRIINVSFNAGLNFSIW